MKKKGTKWEVLEALAMVTQIGLSLITCMAISLFIGYWLDRICGTKFIIIIMMFIGIGASIRSLVMLTRNFASTMEDKKSGNSEKKSS